MAAALAAAIPGADLVEIPNAAHIAPMEAPGAVTEAIANFLLAEPAHQTRPTLATKPA